jgi:ABC-type transporter Mla MlaB component
LAEQIRYADELIRDTRALRDRSRALRAEAHGLRIRSWSTLARRQLTLTGKVDSTTLAALHRAVIGARRAGYEVALDVSAIESVDRAILDELLELAARSPVTPRGDLGGRTGPPG